ncbi:High-osmolarity-induced transcription protein 1 [Fusarium austroafricanum]|uniref:High-osmolarity-induced transcription protein 1 n=1 Tax=Fusarium austroafricanum TaxID=2364996 RepID=A0A8H4KHK9_9HYPO|nr:High-osmolarity-induced transcription protein 1 [Fusarium austroafricanum]
MDNMEQRIQMHVVLMDGLVSFMKEVKQGKFSFRSDELEIARAFGGVHLDEVRRLSLVNSGPAQNYPMPVQQSVEQYTTEHVVFDDDVEGEVHEPVQPMQQEIFDQLPPTPDMDTAPVRSTGRRAPKRKNPPARPHRKVKRRETANVRSVRLRSARPRNGSSWNAINSYKEADSDGEQMGKASDDEYTPDPQVEDEEEDDDDSDDEVEDTPNTPASPASPCHSDNENDFDTSNGKPRYSVTRSNAPRYAAGPAGRRFRYHKMPKTVALVWKEWKDGSNGNPAIEALEKKYNTSWRMGNLQERKYASNYVGVRQKIVRKVEEMCEERGMSVKTACRILDERVDGRMQLLMTALRKGQDPLKVIPKR